MINERERRDSKSERRKFRSDSETIQLSIDEKEEELQRNQETIDSISKVNMVIFPLIIVLVIAIISIIFLDIGFFEGREIKTISIAYALVFLALMISRLSYARSRKQKAEQDINELEFQIEIMRYPISEREVRAERLFRRNEYDLARYYNLNLRQNQWVLYIGMSCIGAGLAIVFATLAIVFGAFDSQVNSEGSKAGEFEIYTKSIIAAVGAVGAIMVNVVAAIYLQMHSRAAEALGEFHKRLVGTNQLFLSNVLAARVTDDDAREGLLGVLATQIAQAEGQ